MGGGRRSPPTCSSRMCAAASSGSCDPAAGRQLPGDHGAGGLRQRRPARARPRRGPREGRAARRACRLRLRRRRRGIRHGGLPAILGVFAFIVLRGLLRLLREQRPVRRAGRAPGWSPASACRRSSTWPRTLHLIPTKGMTLPFISYGGSSALAVALGMGMLLALTRRRHARGPAMRGPAVRPIVIAAGGTGGHFFPAEALAAELLRARPARRADDRCALAAGCIARCSPGASSFVLRGAGIAGRGVLRAARRAVAALARGHAAGARASWRGSDAAAVVGFGGYPVGRAGARRAAVAPAPGRRAARAERRARPRQPVPGAPRRHAGAELRRHRRACRPALRTRGHRQSGAPGHRRAGRRAPTRRRPATIAAAGARRLARRARVQRRRARALAALPEALRARLRVTQQCRAEDLDRVRAAYADAGIAAELAPFFADVADAAGRGASGDRARRRLHRRRTGGGRPAGDPGAAAGRDRRPPDAPMRARWRRPAAPG